MVSLDSENAVWLRENMDNGNLPNLAALARRGTVRDVNSALLAGAAYPSMYSGVRPADHGCYFPIQWNPREQRMQVPDRQSLPELVIERLDRAGKRVVVIDPPECPPLSLQHGFCISGLQFRARILLNKWTSDPVRARQLLRLAGPVPAADEIFGAPALSDFRYLRGALLTAPARLTAAALDFLRQDPPDCLWLSCCGLHVAGHQFFQLPSVADPGERRVLEGTRLELAQGYDRMLGTLAAALPSAARILVAYSKGMDHVTDWLAALPVMLHRILGQERAAAPVAPLRGLLPRAVRRWIASGMSDRLAIETMARLSTPRADWPQTRAFCLPSDYPGFVRLNAAGREREGIVPEPDLAALREEIAAGLRSFTTLDGEPCVESVETPAGLFGDGRLIGEFPDLIVRWKRLPAGVLAGAIRSPRFGEIPAMPDSVGRAGNHTPGAFAILDRPSAGGPVEVEDIAATLTHGAGLPSSGVPGTSFWVP